MNPHPDVVALTRKLLSFDTINPPGAEQACAEYLGALLERSGFRVDYAAFAPTRTSVVARIGRDMDKPPLGFTGHMDTVPLGGAQWKRDPFGASLEGGRLYGRGSSDMKSGVAAFVVAALAQAERLRESPGVTLVLTADEECGCGGAAHLARETSLLGRVGALLVGEPTANYPLVGHKGSLKFHAAFRGVSAHGSMPHLGENAVYKAARAVAKLEEFDFKAKKHAIMGEPTLNVGTFEGGSGVNLVPDLAKIGVDIRTVPGVDHKKLISRLKTLMGKADVDVFSDLPPVWTAPDDDWMQRVFEICKPVLGKKPRARTATYMTDAANLLKVYAGAPTVVLGPGEAQMAHQTDEYCNMERIRESVAIYEALIDDWIR